MSLAVLADHMASKGRGPDSMLIHMSPREVQGLQALAMKHGGSLTINPETGLPEAGFLDKLLPTIIGAGLTFFGGVPPNVAAMIVGGIQTARTGSLMEGIKAGAGAYGGADLTSGLMEAGTSTIGAAEAAKGLTMTPELAAELQIAGEGAKDTLLQQQVTDRMAAATPYEKLSSGFDAFKNNPMGMTKSLAMPAAMAFGPAILAEANVKQNMPQTVTKPGMITPYSSFGGQFVAGTPYQATPTRAAEGGLMGMDNGGYAPGQLNFAQQTEPVMRMAEGGGIVALAAGGDYRSLTKDSSAEDIASAYKQFTTASGGDTAANQKAAIDYLTNLGIGQDKIGQAYGNFQASPTYTNYSNEQIGKYLTDNPTANIAAAAKDTNANPTAVNQYIANLTSGYTDPTATKGGSGTLGIYNQMKAQGIDPDELYSASVANNPKYAGFSKDDITKAYNLDKNAYALSDQLKGNVSDKDWVKLMDDNKYSVLDAARAFGLSTNEVQSRYDAVKKAEKPVITCGFGMRVNAAGTACEPIVCGPGFQLNKAGTACEAVTAVDDKVVDKVVVDDKVVDKVVDKIIDWKDCGTGYHWDKAAQACVKNVDATQNTTTTVDKPTNIDVADDTALPVGVSGAGITTINPNGTVTTRPDLSLGMSTVRDAYEKGGGNLGVNKNLFVPKTYKEVEDRYKLTGGSKQAYDYLTGKTKYTPTPYTEDGQIAKSYAESVMKIPVASSSKMYIFKNGKYEVNPDYAIPTYDKDGKKSSNLTNADVKTFMDKKPSTDAFYTWATTNNLSPEQVALASDRPINEISKLFTGAKDLLGEDGKIDQTKVDEKTAADEKTNFDADAYLKANPDVQAELDAGKANFGTKADLAAAAWEHYQRYGKPEGRAYTKKAAEGGLAALTMARGGTTHMPFFSKSTGKFTSRAPQVYADGGMSGQFDLGGYSDGGRLLRGPGDGVSDSIPATIGNKRPARLADGEFVVPARIVSELGNGSTEAGARKLYAMMDRVQSARRGTVGKGRVAKNSRSDKYLPA